MAHHFCILIVVLITVSVPETVDTHSKQVLEPFWSWVILVERREIFNYAQADLNNPEYRHFYRAWKFKKIFFRLTFRHIQKQMS